MRETIQNYFEKRNNILIITQMKILVLFVMVLKRELIRVYFLLRGKMKQICLYLKKNMDIHYLQKLMIILICFGILVLEDIVILKNYCIILRFEKGRRF